MLPCLTFSNKRDSVKPPPQAQRQSSVTGGHKLFWGVQKTFFLKFESEVFIAKYVRNSTNSGVKTKKKKVFIAKSAENGSCLRKLGWWPVFWGSQASNCTPMPPSLLLSLGYNPRLGGTFLVWGNISSDLGARLRNALRSAGPAPP